MFILVSNMSDLQLILLGNVQIIRANPQCISYTAMFTVCLRIICIDVPATCSSCFSKNCWVKITIVFITVKLYLKMLLRNLDIEVVNNWVLLTDKEV